LGPGRGSEGAQIRTNEVRQPLRLGGVRWADPRLCERKAVSLPTLPGAGRWHAYEVDPQASGADEAFREVAELLHGLRTLEQGHSQLLRRPFHLRLGRPGRLGQPAERPSPLHASSLPDTK